ncbi:isocitrate/isopropylmalate dehydrogenase family protein [Streptomyces sp. 110]|uniref:Isocitrate/isopropylmalate dehydrogenase family protein n=1 Tax=Streptomyces endocoffeicus TaxID=2898945 RepID=A0ABS1PRD1_9ACTN|nr:isocitrate/isopropylmalate family dehydrogenase [Streptomyces endocoffeicus]MBL1114998.1 isocitrate/isopropylmalate dehydrogenase family protein [Streptomyces endocoffeicus]
MTRIAVIPGDGIGPEVVEQAVLTLDEFRLGLDFDFLDHVNADTYLRTDVALSDEDVARVASSRSALLGAIGDPRVGSPAYGRGVLLRLRFDLDLYVNYRPAKLLSDRLSPLRRDRARAVDCVVIRENTEGLYTGLGGSLRPGGGHEIALDIDLSTHRGTARVVDHAFSVARREVCMVDKANAVEHGGGLWQRCWRTAAARHPDMATRHMYVDAAAMRMVTDPTTFDVIVTNNSYGDILSDVASAVAGGIGTAASANLNPERGFGLYEPVHGSAPDIAGKQVANPIGAILSAGLLLADLGHTAEAAALRHAVARAVTEGETTPDLGGPLDTRKAGQAVRARL